MGVLNVGFFFSILIALTIVPIYADDAWIVVGTNKDTYHIGEMLELSGYILEKKMPVIAMSIHDPDGIILTANNVEIESDGSITKTISLDAPFYEKAGVYTINFDYGKKSEEITFEMVSENPETIFAPIPDLTPEVIFLTTDKEKYQNDDTITISGIVSSIGDSTILIGIYDPNNMPTGFYTPTIDENMEFSVSFPVKAGVNFKIEGLYSIKAHYGTSNMTTSFGYENIESSSNPPTTEKKSIQNSAKPSQPSIEEKAQKIQDEPPKITPPKSVSEPHAEESKQEDIVKETDTDNFDNLSVEDKELGELLNELMLNCDNSEYNDSIIYYDGMGPALMRLCSYDQAISYFDQSLRNNPNDVRVITNKGSAIGKLGKTDEAIYYYDVALDIDPAYIPALNNKANALAEQGKIESAIEIYKSILRKDPSYIIVQDNLQKAQSNLVFQRPNTETDLVNVDYPILAEPIELANSNKSDDLVKDSPHTILEQLGGVFASFFSFLG